MPLLNGNSVHPRFPWYGRIPGAGAMLALTSVFAVETPQAVPDTTWDPWSTDPAVRVPQSGQLVTEVFRGMGRYSPNQDWRARVDAIPAQDMTEYAMRVQIDFKGNRLPGLEGVMPLIGVGFWVRARSIVELQGQPADDTITQMNFVVRTISSSSMSWQKTLLCDAVPNNLKAAIGG